MNLLSSVELEELKSSRSTRGKFIVLEGVGGSGKSTLIKHLQQSLRGKYVFYGAHTATNVGEAVREFIVSDSYDLQTQVALFMASFTATSTKIEDVLANGINVIMDRWFYSTLIYQAEEKELVHILSKFIQLGYITEPDKFIVLDSNVETITNRLRDRNESDHLDLAEDCEVLDRRLRDYRAMASHNPNGYVVKSGDNSNAIVQGIISTICK